MILKRLPVLFLASILLCACSSFYPWQSAYNKDHALVGKVWNVAEARFVDQNELIADVKERDFVLLGETHNNPDHHILQAYIIKSLVSLGRRPIISLEMLNMSQTDALTNFSASYPKSSENFFKAMSWENSGWPESELYTPIIDEALTANLNISAVNISRQKTKNLMAFGLEGLTPGRIKQLQVDKPLPKITQDLLKDEIQKSHCGYATKDLLDKMVFAQFVKDAHMAWVISKSKKQNGAVLIAGVGHIRKDWAIPFHLKRLMPNATIATIAFLEVIQGGQTIADYSMNSEKISDIPYDYIWFTPRADNENACEKFKNQLKRMQTK